jgi:putative hydrolase of HD superfamily
MSNSAAMPEQRLSPELIEAIGRLKEVPRSGWLDRGIPRNEAESVADHSYGVALLAWLLAPDEIDRARAVELALLHDLAESAVGDMTPYDQELLQTLDPDTRRNWLNQRHVRTEEQQAAKKARESAAIEKLAASLPAAQRDRLLDRWAELSARTTPEAKFVKQMDLLETWLQSRRYAERHPDAPMESFELEARALLGEWIDG